jgi:OmpA-OmpF porin, OOP family
MTRTVQLVIATVLALCSVAAQAQAMNPGDSQFYVGIGGGATKMNGYCEAVNATAGFAGTCDESTTGFKAFGDYKLNRYFGLEAGFSNFGEASAAGTIGSTPVVSRWRGYGIDLSAIGFLPLGEHFELFAKGGVAFWDIKATLPTSTSREANDSGLSGVAGAGAIWWLFPQVGLRVQYERFQKVGDDSVQVQTNVDYVSVNVVGRF